MLERGSFFSHLFSRSFNMCFYVKKKIISSLSASIFAFLILRFYLLFVAMRHLRWFGFFYLLVCVSYVIFDRKWDF